MSKAFTREDDEFETEMAIPRAELPAGARNLLTADGSAHLQAKLAALREEQRKLEAGATDDAVTERLRRIHAHAQTISSILTSAEVVSPPEEPIEEARFGAFVSVRDSDGVEQEYRIVGVDEMDLDRGWISWLSPLARTLLGKKRGDVVQFTTPDGERELRVVMVRYAGG